MKKLYEKIKNKNKEIKYIFMMLCSAVILAGGNIDYAFADGLDDFINFLCPWIVKIGCVVAMVGGVQMAIGFKQEDPDAKVRGLMTLAAGFMVAAIGKAPSIFGI